MPNVFIPNKGSHDYTDAKRFGELTYVTSGYQNKYSLGSMIRCWKHALETSSPDDYILQTSLSILNAVGIALFALKHNGRCNILIWKKDRYIERQLHLNDTEPIKLNPGESDDRD